MPRSGKSGACLFFLVHRLEGKDKSGGNGGIQDHIIPGLDWWIHSWIHVDCRCREAEDNPQGGGDKGLEPVQNMESINGSYCWAEEGSDGSMKPGDGFHQRELKKAHLPADRIVRIIFILHDLRII